MANTVFFSLHNYCVSEIKTKTPPKYTEVRQEDITDDVVEGKPDLKKSEGKIRRLFPPSRWMLLLERDAVCE